MPQRFLRPGITDSDRWNSVSFEAQSLYIRLITIVDDYGRFDGRPSVICGRCFAVWNALNAPCQHDAVMVTAWCCELESLGLLTFYEHDGKRFLQMSKWTERPRVKSQYPEPNAEMLSPCTQHVVTVTAPCTPSSPSPSPSPSPSSHAPHGQQVLLADVSNGDPKSKHKAKGTKEEIVEWCRDNGIPNSDAEWLWNHWEGNGWTNAGKPIKSWPHTIAAWKGGKMLPSQKLQNPRNPKGTCT